MLASDLISRTNVGLRRSKSSMISWTPIPFCWRIWGKICQSALENSSLRDRDVIEALVALVRSSQTRATSGLHYEPTGPSLAQQALIQELREVIAVNIKKARR